LFPAISKVKKNELWSRMADDVSSLGPDRTIDQCKKKISDTKSASKAKAAKISSQKRKTGGGPPCLDELDDIEEMIVAKLPKVSVEVKIILKIVFGEIC